MEYLVGLLIGSVLGLTGAGGSVFAVPLLIYLLQLTPQNAIGISLGAVCASALFGVLTQLNAKKIQWLPAIVFATIGALVSPLGVYLNKQIDPSLLMIGFSILVLIVAGRMWQQASNSPGDAKIVRSAITKDDERVPALCRANNNQPFKIGVPCIAAVSGAAVATGILSGLFGVGGGFLIVPTLVFLTGIRIQEAVATSLLIISLVCLSGFLGFLASGTIINYSLLAKVAIGGIIGMIFGTVVSRFIAGPSLQKLFAVLMLIMACITVYSTFAI